jgi:hypothetical protein
MRNRNAKFVSAILLSTLAGASVEALTQGPAHAAADCLSAPKGASPAGSHWYYRIDRPTKRHCWYLAERDGKLSQSAPPKSFHRPRAIAPVARSSVQHPVADARAELPSQAIVAAGNRNEVMASVAPDPTESSRDGVGLLPPSSIIATRWPEPAGVGSPVMMASNQAADQPPDPPSRRSPAIAPAALAAESPQGRSASIPMLLAVMAGALALAGITASIVLKLGGARTVPGSRAGRAGLWDRDDDDRINVSAKRIGNVLRRGGLFPRIVDRAGETDDRVAEFYRKLSDSPSRTPT